MEKMAVVFGTRPEAIQLCPVVLEFRKHYMKGLESVKNSCSIR